MRRSVAGLPSVLVLLSLSSALLAEEEPFAIDPSKAVLRIGGSDLKPIAALTPAPEGALVGDLRIRIDGNRVFAVRATDGKAAWTAVAKGADSVGVFAIGNGTLWCGQWRMAATDKDPSRPSLCVDPGAVHRLRMDGTWVDPPLRGPAPVQVEDRFEHVMDVLPLADGAIVLRSFPWKRAPFEEGGTVRITRFRGEPPVPVWSRTLDYARLHEYRLPYPGWIPPEGGFDDRRRLTLAGHHLVITPTTEGDITALEVESGETAWTLKRAGEWERWFIGPSVWASGISCPDEMAKRSWRIFGGPVAVPYDRGSGTEGATYTDKPPPARPGYRLFLVVAKEKVENRPPKEPGEQKDGESTTFREMSEIGETDSRGHNVDPVVYEVNDRGEPVAMAVLPRMAADAPRRVTPGGALFTGEERYGLRMAWLVPTFQHTGEGMNGTSQHLARVAWWRHLPEFPAGPPARQRFRLPAPWERARTAGPSDLYRLDTGAYRTTEEPSTLRFPIVRTDLATGADERFTVQVPFRGAPPQDKFTESYTESEEGWTPDPDGPPTVFVSDMALSGRMLHITLHAGNGPPALLVFELPPR
jgi:hypothetical protein